MVVLSKTSTRLVSFVAAAPTTQPSIDAPGAKVVAAGPAPAAKKDAAPKRAAAAVPPAKKPAPKLASANVRKRGK